MCDDETKDLRGQGVDVGGGCGDVGVCVAVSQGNSMLGM